jgi:hypothetical protein
MVNVSQTANMILLYVFIVQKFCVKIQLFIETSAETVYYRLKQVDYDGKETILSTVVVNRSFNETAVYPNPFSDYLAINFKAETSGVYSFEFIDAIGVSTIQKMTISKGNNFIKLSTDQLTKAFYMLRIVSNEGEIETVSKIIKK